MNLCVFNDRGYICVYPIGAPFRCSAYARLCVTNAGVCKFSMFYGNGLVSSLRQGDYDTYVSDGMSYCGIRRMEQLINATADMVFDPSESAEHNAAAIVEALLGIFREEI